MIALMAVSLAAVSGWLFAGPCWARQRLVRLGELPSHHGDGERVSVRAVARREVARMLRRVRRAGAERAARQAMVELCTGLAGELRAGRSPAEALRLGVDALGLADRVALAGLVAAAGRGGDVPDAMRAVSTQPGRRALAWLAACWQVGAESGAGLAEAVERLAGSLRNEDRCRREIAAQLAAPRATARLLAALPVVGIVFATGLGQRPVAFLLGSPYGAMCLAAGVVLDLLGLAWTARLARSAEAS